MKNNKGQSLVEYILLLVVIAFIAVGIFKGTSIGEMFGKNSKFFKYAKHQLEYTYRHGNNYTGGIEGIEDNSNYQTFHHTYTKESGESRFFGPIEEYGGR